MNLISLLRQYFAAINWSRREAMTFRPIPDLPPRYPAWVIHDKGFYGVAIPYFKKDIISERFESCRFYSDPHSFGAFPNSSLLILATDRRELRQEFAAVCAQFVDPGENDENRIMLENNPLLWWENWGNLLGNSLSSFQPYTLLGEMIALNELLKIDPQVKWTGPKFGTVDIETKEEDFEVKTTLSKYKATIEIHSQHQLYVHDKALALVFIRLEEAEFGYSINDIAQELVQNGYSKELLETQLATLGYEKGSSARNKRYYCLEKRKYLITENFPKITAESFKDNHIPYGITKIMYTIDLDALEYEPF